MWRDEALFGDPLRPGNATVDDANRFGRELAARSSSARVGLAHALCEAGLDLLMAGQGLTKHEAARRLRRRQHGRRPSMLNDTEAA